MRPGIIVQYARTPERTGERVRSDVAGIVGFIPPERRLRGPYRETTSRWFFTKRRTEGHPDQALFDDAAQTAAHHFENGGAVAHVFGVCIQSIEDLKEFSQQVWC